MSFLEVIEIISRAIGYQKATVNDNIRRMLKAGTLSPLDQ